MEDESISCYTRNEAKPYVIAALGEYRILSLIDTGSSSSLMSATLYKALFPELVLHHTKESFVGAGGATIKCWGEIKNIPVCVVEGQIWMINFVVLENLKEDMLIGMDVLREHSAVIDLGWMVIRTGMPEGSAEILREGPRREVDEVFPIVALSEEIIKPGECRVVEAMTDTVIFSSPQTALVVALEEEDLMLKIGLLMWSVAM